MCSGFFHDISAKIGEDFYGRSRKERQQYRAGGLAGEKPANW